MEVLKFLKNFQLLVSILAIILSSQLVSGQISTACSGAMLRSFSPCINFITNGGNNSSPTSDCCRSLKYVMSNGTDCLCLIVTGNVPFRVPINRTLAVSLPKACNMAGVPLQCTASASPIPAPGPAALAPTKSPRSSQRPRSPPSPSPEAANVPQPLTPSFGPVADTTPGNPNTDLTPPSPTDSFGNPDDNSGFKPDLTPSTTPSSDRFSTFVLLAACATMAFKFY